MNDVDPIAAGSITFYDNFVPSLQAGQYTVTVSQALKAQDNGGTSSGVPTSPQDALTQTFIVRGPRFVLDPADVHRVFPPSNATGQFDQYLPMIVLNKRALPWERQIQWNVDNYKDYPWLALLLFSEDDLFAPQPPTGGSDLPPAGSQQNPTRTASFPLTNVVTSTNSAISTVGPPSGTLGPSIYIEDDEDPNTIFCNVIEMAADTFTNLAPTVHDLGFLAHVRQVSTEHKEPQNSPHDGWFSAVICNRFAMPPATGGAQQRNVAHLVSLEGMEEYIGGDNISVPAKLQKVRLISLYSWTFTCLPDPQENFSQLMLDLTTAASEQNTDLLLKLPVSASIPAPETPAEQLAFDRLNSGYVPLSYATWSGEETFAWYRGPLSPVPTSSFMDVTGPASPENLAAPRNAAEAMVYDPSTGLFDQSYAVAFQTGRSLALSSMPFATALLQWRRAAHSVVDLLLELMLSPDLRAKLQKDGILDASGNLTATGVEDLADLLDAGIISNAFRDFLATEVADNLASKIGQAGGYTAQDQGQTPANPPTPTPAVPADLANLMQNPLVIALLQQLSGLEEPTSNNAEQFEPGLLPETIVPWLARLALFYGVPFNNLVPSSAMLPVGSIRFFYVDPNWVDSLLDGALSVGMQTSRDTVFHQLMRDSLHRAVNEVIAQVRDQLRNVAIQSSPPPPVAMSGFLLRSAAVSGWAGLEVRAWSSADKTNPMKPLRLDRLAPSVMIAIYPDVPVKVEINEPSEGLVFGHEDNGVALRYIPGVTGATADNLGEVLQPVTWLAPGDIAKTRRPQPPNLGASQIAGAGGLVQALQAKFPPTQPTLSPASFAVQIVRVPEQMLFLPQSGGTQ